MYLVPERPENRETYVSRFRLAPLATGRLAVTEARLDPVLDEGGEAHPADAGQSATDRGAHRALLRVAQHSRRDRRRGGRLATYYRGEGLSGGSER